LSPAATPNRAAKTLNRRSSQRFPISNQVIYITERLQGNCVTCNLSSGGVFLKTKHALPIVKRIQLLIDWPAKLDNRLSLRLLVKGRVLRSTEEGTAVRVLAYEFRVHSRQVGAGGRSASV
jgi:hypothetical protein